MKKIFILLAALFCLGAHAQNGVEVFAGFITDTLTTAELDALPSRVKRKGAHFYNNDINSLVSWNGSGWTPISSANDLELTGNLLELTNPITPGNSIDLSPYLDAPTNLSQLANDLNFIREDTSSPITGYRISVGGTSALAAQPAPSGYYRINIDTTSSPATTDYFIDGLTLGLDGSDLTVTASRNGTTDVVSNILTLPDGATVTGSESAFDGWDKNASDDFDGAFTSLSGIPLGLLDGDDNTQRTDEEIEDIIGLKVVAGSNVTVNYNDTTGETTISSTASVPGSTNLSYTTSSTQGTVVSDTGTDAVIPAGSTTNASLMLPGDKTKLNGIESGADVTDATNVNAAGATMNTDTSVSGNSWVLDEDNMVSNSNTKVPTQQSVKAYVDAVVGQTEGTFNVTVGGSSGGTFGTVTNPYGGDTGSFIIDGNKVDYWITLSASSPSSLSGSLYIEPDWAFTIRTGHDYPISISTFGVSVGEQGFEQIMGRLTASSGRIQFNYTSTAPATTVSTSYPAPSAGVFTIRLHGTFLIN